MLLGCALAAQSGHAQEVPASYERLAVALADGELVVGEVPAGFPNEIIPEDGELLGSIQGRGPAIVVVVVPRPVMPVQQEIREALLESGWDYAPATKQVGFQQAAVGDGSDGLAASARVPNFS